MGAGIELRNQVLADPAMIDRAKHAWVPMDDFADLYLKGLIATVSYHRPQSHVKISIEGKNVVLSTLQQPAFEKILGLLKSDLGVEEEYLRKAIRRKQAEIDIRQMDAVSDGIDEERISELRNEIAAVRIKLRALGERLANINAEEKLGTATPSDLVAINGGIVKINSLSGDSARGKLLVPLSSDDKIAGKDTKILYISTSKKKRKFSDVQVALVENLKSRGLIEKRLKPHFLYPWCQPRT